MTPRPQVDGLSPSEGRGAVAITSLALFTLAILPATPGPDQLLGLDKLEHMAAFAALTVLIRCGWPDAPRWLSAIGALGFGVVIEAVQSLDFIGRTPSMTDMIANALGVALGLLAAAGLHCLADARRTRRS